MIGDAFEYSEKYHTPVLFRPTTRICHGCASVELKERVCLPEPEGFVKDSNKWVIFPRLSNANHRMIEERNPVIGEDFSSYRFNLLHRENEESGKGIITHGINYESVMEALNGYQGVRVLKISTPNPMPEKLMLEFMDGLKEVMAVEELDPVLEQELLLLCGKHHLDVNVRGKLTRDVQSAGENSVESVRNVLEAYLGRPYIEYLEKIGAAHPVSPLPVPPLPIRPPVLCAGCPHRASFYAVKRAMEKLSAFTTDQLADLFIVSDVEIAQGAGAAGVKVPGIQAAVSEAKGEKCERCWKHHIKVGADKEHPTLCPRCAKVIRTIEL